MGLLDWLTDKATKLLIKPLADAGPRPNAIPPDTPRKDDPPRKVILGWHPIAGMAGKKFEELVTPFKLLDGVAQAFGAPNPTHHWGVLVGDYFHELNAVVNDKDDLVVVYQNLKYDGKVFWFQKEVGVTRFNDEALRLAGIEAIKAMPPNYNIQSNNCQKFALAFLDAILEGGRTEKFTTSYGFSRDTYIESPTIRPAVKVFATAGNEQAVMAAAKAKEADDATAEGSYPGMVICQTLETEEAVEAARKAYESELALASMEKAAKLAEKALKAAQAQIDAGAPSSEITITTEVDEKKAEEVKVARGLMMDETPALSASDLASLE